MRSDAQRRADEAYRSKPEVKERQREKYRHISCALDPATYEAFKLECLCRGTTPSEVIRGAIADFLKK